MISAIIYDLDDTMVNSDPLHARAWEELLKEHGHEFRALPEELRSSFIGMRVVDIVSEIVDYLDIKANKDDLYKKRIELFLEIVENELEPMPGLLESLKRFKAAGFKLAVASSGAGKYIDLVLTKFDIQDYFDAVVTGDDVKIGKPHPEAYLIAAKKLQLDPAVCLVLEDATKGIQSAKAAGCKCIAIKNPNVPSQDFSTADLVVESLNDITLDVVKKLA
jgi:beta-phosphoglucomutase